MGRCESTYNSMNDAYYYYSTAISHTPTNTGEFQRRIECMRSINDETDEKNVEQTACKSCKYLNNKSNCIAKQKQNYTLSYSNSHEYTFLLELYNSNSHEYANTIHNDIGSNQTLNDNDCNFFRILFCKRIKGKFRSKSFQSNLLCNC